MDLIERKQISNSNGIQPPEKSNVLFRKTISANDSLPKFDWGTEYLNQYVTTGSGGPRIEKPGLQTMTSGQKSVFGNKQPANLKPGEAKIKWSGDTGIKANTPSKHGFNIGNVDTAAAIGGTLQTIGAVNAASQYNKTAADFVGSAGSTQGSINGISYQQLNPIDEGKELSQVSQENSQSALGAAASGAAAGAALGSVAGPWGAAIGGVVGGLAGGISGIFAGKSKKRKAEEALAEARRRQQVMNLTNQDIAGTTGLQQTYAQKYGNLDDQSLYAAAEGKESMVNPITGETFKRFMVNTGEGKKYDTQNAWVSKGEVIWSKDNDFSRGMNTGFGRFSFGMPSYGFGTGGTLYQVKEGPGDTARAHLKMNDTVFSRHVIDPETGLPVADAVPLYAMTGRLHDLENNQQIGRRLQQMNTIDKYRKLSGYDNGKESSWLNKTGKWIGNNILPRIDGNLMSTVENLVAANSQYREASQPLRETNVGEVNPYEQKALNDLYGLHLDYYPVARQNRDIEARGYNQLIRSGGLSAGQRMKAATDMMYKTQMSNADALYKNNVQNNAYLAAAAEAALNTGYRSAQLKQQANIFNEEMLAKAHNAAVQGKQMSLFNAMNAFANYQANAFKQKMGNKALSLYEQQVNGEAADRAAMIAAMKSGNNEAKEKEQELLPGPDFYLNRNLNSNKPAFTDKYGIRQKNITDFDWSNPVIQQKFADKWVPFVMPKIGPKKRVSKVKRTTKRK